MENLEKVPVVFVLHAYQPITQNREILERIINNCYIPFFSKLLENKEVKISLNISGCLLEKLSIEYPEVIKLVEKAILTNQIELMGSAFYHPILPLLSEEDITYQIRKQNEIIKGLFDIKPIVFFPPELAISQSIIPYILREGFETIICPTNAINVTYGGVYDVDDRNRIFLLKRNKIISNKIAFDEFKRDDNKTLSEIIKEYNQFNLPIVLAMDLEAFGEHHGDYYNFFFSLTKKMSLLRVSEMTKEFKISTRVDFFTSSSWSTTNQDLKEGIYFPLWHDPLNVVHQLQHSHLELLKQVKSQISKGDWYNDYQAAHYSCQFWWASEIWWSPELIHTGLIFQKMTLKKMSKELSETSKQVIFNLSEYFTNRIDELLSKKRLDK